MIGKTLFNLLNYERAINKSACYLNPGSGYLRISGPDRIDFLQRQTTNDLNLLAPGHILVTALTSPTARILDILTLVIEEDAIGAITLPELAAQTAAYLQSRIFFMDNVSVSDTSAEFAQIDLLGPEVSKTMSAIGFSGLIEPGEVLSNEINGVDVQAFNTFGSIARLLVPSDGIQNLISALEGVGTHRLETDTYEVLRVEAGLPAAGHELTEDYTPLETGLTEIISMTKGCFTGQEVIARQVNFDKVTKQMVGLHLEEEVKSGALVKNPENSQPVGNVTSAITSPRFGPIALAILKRPQDKAGTELIAEYGANSINATVSSLPFLSDLQV